jgi:WD40 repeat protein
MHTQIRRLTQEGNSTHPIWTPDSRRITFASDRGGAWGIYWQPADGSGVAERLTTAAKGAQQWPESWSPDGRVLAFVNQSVSGSNGTQALRTLSLERGATEVFYDLPGLTQMTQNGMAFSPDGKWVAYSSIEQGSQFLVFVEPFPRGRASGTRSPRPIRTTLCGRVTARNSSIEIGVASRMPPEEPRRLVAFRSVLRALLPSQMSRNCPCRDSSRSQITATTTSHPMASGSWCWFERTRSMPPRPRVPRSTSSRTGLKS